MDLATRAEPEVCAQRRDRSKRRHNSRLAGAGYKGGAGTPTLGIRPADASTPGIRSAVAPTPGIRSAVASTSGIRSAVASIAGFAVGSVAFRLSRLVRESNRGGLKAQRNWNETSRPSSHPRISENPWSSCRLREPLNLDRLLSTK